MQKFIVGQNDLASLCPELLKEWDYEKNITENPYKAYVSSGKKVWWKCKNGHCWKAQIASRTRNGRGCPFCAGQKVIVGVNDLATCYPDLAKEWNYEKNGELSPRDVMAKSGKKIWWKCSRGHEWCVSPNMRIFEHTGCPMCSKEFKTSFAEQAIYYYFKKNIKCLNRYCIDNVEIDIYIPSLRMGIEYDGKYFHKGKEAKIRERKKDEYCKLNNIDLYRIKETVEDISSNNKIFYHNIKRQNSLDEIIEMLLNVAKEKGALVFDLDINVERDRKNIYSNYISVVKSNNIKMKYPELSSEWDYEKNGNLLPEHVTSGSHKKVWWKCSKGHEWQVAVSKRTIEHTGCPYCANKKVLEGFNDMATINPQVLLEWNYEKNEIKPTEVTSYSNKKAWWKCRNGHDFCMVIARYLEGQRCPYCSGRKVLQGFNDFQTEYPILAKEWDYEKNAIKPTEVTKGSNKKVWWKCSICGYEWEAIVSKRSSGRGCPVCAKETRVNNSIRKIINLNGSLQDVYPELIKEWNYEKNEVNPAEIARTSNRKVWWKCKNGHEWQAIISNRTSKKQGCPYCRKIKGIDAKLKKDTKEY